MKNLAPTIYRQRLVIEGYPKQVISDSQIKEYLSGLAKKIDMKELLEPITHRSDTFGWAGWIHWETSGAHFYAWEQPMLFYSVDIYTCKQFDAQTAVAYTKDFFGSKSVEFKEF